MAAWLQDLRYGLRLLMRSPGFTLMAVAALAAWLPGRRTTRVDPVIALRAEGPVPLT